MSKLYQNCAAECVDSIFAACMDILKQYYHRSQLCFPWIFSRTACRSAEHRPQRRKRTRRCKWPIGSDTGQRQSEQSLQAVKRNRGAAGIDGMTVEEALPWLKERRGELLQSIRDGSYVPSPVRRKEIPKPDGGVRKLGIPTVVDRVIQQAIAQKLQSIWEPLFSDSSYGAGSECTSGSSGRSPERRWPI